jgi:hypothetical protein
MKKSNSAVKQRWSLLALGICTALAGGTLIAAAQTPPPAAAPAPAQQRPQQQPHPQKQKVTLSMLAAQGFEVKATINSYLVVQRGKDVWLCYMLDTRSDCVAAD